MRVNHPLTIGLLATAMTATSLGAVRAHAAGAPGAGADPRAEYGVTLALSGETAKAESLFVSMLSLSRGDARALNNLGNLRLLRGDLGVALAFYERAARGDSADAGIQLNRATALLLMGEDARSEAAYAAGIRLAGGADRARALLGLAPEKGEAARADSRQFLNKSDVRAMLQKAAAAVPADTSPPATKQGAQADTKRKSPQWRSAGPRASDGGDAATVLYWKR